MISTKYSPLLRSFSLSLPKTFFKNDDPDLKPQPVLGFLPFPSFQTQKSSGLGSDLHTMPLCVRCCYWINYARRTSQIQDQIR
jgi:hypothetical protein